MRGRGEIGQCRPLTLLPLEDFQQDYAGDAVDVGEGIADLLSPVEFAGDSIDGLVGVIFGERAAAPLEESYQAAVNLLVFLTSAVRSVSRAARSLLKASGVRLHFFFFSCTSESATGSTPFGEMRLLPDNPAAYLHSP